MTLILDQKQGARERILAFGGAGSGKTHDWLSVANRYAQAAREGKPLGRFYVIDSDFTVERSMEAYPGVEEVVESRTTPEWADYTEAIDHFIKKVTRFDWLVFDMVSPMWEMAQESYIERIFKKDMDEFYIQHREAAKKGGAMDGFKDWCVDADTEILTRTGWKTYDQVTVSELVLTFDEQTGLSNWEPVLKMYIGEARRREMLALEGKSHSSLTTMAHRWLVERPMSGGGYRLQWTDSENLPTDARIPHSAPYRDAPTEAKYTDDMVSLVAWYWTEGWRNSQTLQGGIGQKKPQHVAAIRGMLTRLFGPATSGRGSHWNETTREDGVVTFRLNKAVMEPLLGLVDGKAKVPTWDFLHSLTLAQIHLLIDTAIDGDGSRREGGQTTFYQVDEQGRNLFETAALMAGYGVRTRQDTDGANRFGRPAWQISLLRSAGAWPVMAARLDGSATRTTVMYDQMVWCPVTESGTWFARRRGTVYVTGNSVINKIYKQGVSNHLLRCQGHLFATAGAAPLSGDLDSKEMKAIYARFGVKPIGQKHLSHQFHSVLWKQAPKTNEWTLTTIKDRARESLMTQPIGDFAEDYLVKVAGWPTVETETAEQKAARLAAAREAAMAKVAANREAAAAGQMAVGEGA